MADHEKIKTCFAQIIVNNSEDKPYYSIMYWKNGEMNIGFSSYKLDYVRRWLNEEFEVNRNADVAPVVHGRWKLLHAGDWTSVYVCSVCGRRETVASSDMCDPEDRMSKIYPFCHCGAKMDGGADNATD